MRIQTIVNEVALAIQGWIDAFVQRMMMHLQTTQFQMIRVLKLSQISFDQISSLVTVSSPLISRFTMHIFVDLPYAIINLFEDKDHLQSVRKQSHNDDDTLNEPDDHARKREWREIQVDKHAYIIYEQIWVDRARQKANEI